MINDTSRMIGVSAMVFLTPIASVKVVELLASSGPSAVSAATPVQVEREGQSTGASIVLTDTDQSDEARLHADALRGNSEINSPFGYEIPEQLANEPVGPEVPELAPPPNFNVQAIIGGQSPSALIDNTLRRIGETIDAGWQVESIDITTRSVTLIEPATGRSLMIDVDSGKRELRDPNGVIDASDRESGASDHPLRRRNQGNGGLPETPRLPKLPGLPGT